MGMIVDSARFFVEDEEPVGDPHRYWRLLFPTATNIGLDEVQMRETRGGANVVGGGTPSASSIFNGTYDVPNAFDGNTATFWNCSGSPGANEWIKYDFGAGNEKAIAEIAFRYADIARCPADVKMQWSDDDSAWTDFSPLITIPARRPAFYHCINDQNGGVQFKFETVDKDGATYAAIAEITLGAVPTGGAWGNSSFGIGPLNATDNNTGTRWVSDNVSNPVLSWLGQAGRIEDYTVIEITGWNGGGADWTPPAFDLFYSEDNGVSWNLIDNISEAPWAHQEVRSYPV